MPSSLRAAGELEVARMRAEAQQRAAQEARREAQRRNGPAPDADAEEDAEVAKARAWDDWKASDAVLHALCLRCGPAQCMHALLWG
jgi:hypothetical protein